MSTPTPPPIPMTPFAMAQRFVGLREISGENHDPFIQWCHSLCGLGTDQPDETAWCSAFVNGIAWLLRLPRSKSAMARSWLGVGTPIHIMDAAPGFDVVVFERGGPKAATGHVGFFAGFVPDASPSGADILTLGGNQGDQVSVASYGRARLLGVRRLAP